MNSVTFQDWKLLPVAVGKQAKKFKVINDHSVQAEIQSPTHNKPETIIIAQDEVSKKVKIHFVVQDHRGKYTVPSSEYSIVQMMHDFNDGGLSILSGQTLKSIFTRILSKDAKKQAIYKLNSLSFGSDKLVYITFDGPRGNNVRIPLFADNTVNLTKNIYLKQSKHY